VSRSIEITEELEELSSMLAGLPPHLPFSVPKGYLENLSDDLVASARFAEAEEPPLDLPKALPFETPEKYVESLAQTLTNAVNDANLPKEKAPLFEVPAGYFESLPGRLLHAAKEAELSRPNHAKTISLTPLWKKWTSVAAAAMLLLSLSLGGYHYHEMHTPEAVAAKQLSTLDKESISAYVEQHLEDFDASTLESLAASAPSTAGPQLPVLDTRDIQQYLEESGELPAQNEQAETL